MAEASHSSAADLGSSRQKEANDKAEGFNQSGNAALSQKQYMVAIDMYNSGLELPDVSDDVLAVLHSNKSSASAHIKRWEDALRHARQCIQLKPKWWRGYACEGAAHEGMGEDLAALASFERAQQEDRQNLELRQIIQDIRSRDPRPRLPEASAALTQQVLRDREQRQTSPQQPQQPDAGETTTTKEGAFPPHADLRPAWNKLPMPVINDEWENRRRLEDHEATDRRIRQWELQQQREKEERDRARAAAASRQPGDQQDVPEGERVDTRERRVVRTYYPEETSIVHAKGFREGSALPGSYFDRQRLEGAQKGEAEYLGPRFAMGKKGTRAGVGVELREDKGPGGRKVVVAAIAPWSPLIGMPGEKVEVEDVLESIDDVRVDAIPFDKVHRVILGDPGTLVTLTLSKGYAGAMGGFLSALPPELNISHYSVMVKRVKAPEQSTFWNSFARFEDQSKLGLLGRRHTDVDTPKEPPAAAAAPPPMDGVPVQDIPIRVDADDQTRQAMQAQHRVDEESYQRLQLANQQQHDALAALENERHQLLEEVARLRAGGWDRNASGRGTAVVNVTMEEDYQRVAVREQDRQAMKSYIEEGLCKALQESPGRLSVVGLHPGSVIATVEIAPGDGLANQRSAATVATEIQAQASNPSSAVRRALPSVRSAEILPAGDDDERLCGMMEEELAAVAAFCKEPNTPQTLQAATHGKDGRMKPRYVLRAYEAAQYLKQDAAAATERALSLEDELRAARSSFLDVDAKRKGADERAIRLEEELSQRRAREQAAGQERAAMQDNLRNLSAHSEQLQGQNGELRSEVERLSESLHSVQRSMQSQPRPKSLVLANGEALDLRTLQDMEPATDWDKLFSHLLARHEDIENRKTTGERQDEERHLSEEEEEEEDGVDVSGLGLPEGWTTEEMNGRTLYVHHGMKRFSWKHPQLIIQRAADRQAADPPSSDPAPLQHEQPPAQAAGQGENQQPPPHSRGEPIQLPDRTEPYYPHVEGLDARLHAAQDKLRESLPFISPASLLVANTHSSIAPVPKSSIREDVDRLSHTHTRYAPQQPPFPDAQAPQQPAGFPQPDEPMLPA